jgi:hypothetical protein
MKEEKNSSKFHIDFVSIDFIDENFEDGWRYVMGFDSGDDYTIPEEHLETMDDKTWEKIEEIRKVCFPRD